MRHRPLTKIESFRRLVEMLNERPEHWDNQRCSLYETRVGGKYVLESLDSALAELKAAREALATEAEFQGRCNIELNEAVQRINEFLEESK